MADSTAEKIAKVRVLYERTTNPGEKAAAYEALKRLLGVDQEGQTANGNWLEEMKSILMTRGFYWCCTSGNSQLFSKVNEKVWLHQLSFNRGSWEYYQPNPGRKWVFTDRRPDNRGNTKDQLIKVLK